MWQKLSQAYLSAAKDSKHARATARYLQKIKSAFLKNSTRKAVPWRACTSWKTQRRMLRATNMCHWWRITRLAFQRVLIRCHWPTFRHCSKNLVRVLSLPVLPQKHLMFRTIRMNRTLENCMTVLGEAENGNTIALCIMCLASNLHTVNSSPICWKALTSPLIWNRLNKITGCRRSSMIMFQSLGRILQMVLSKLMWNSNSGQEALYSFQVNAQRMTKHLPKIHSINSTRSWLPLPTWDMYNLIH